MQVYLEDVIESIEFENELLNHFYNKDTEVIIYKEDSSTAKYSADDINDLDKFEEWERELIISLYDLKENPDNYIKLPKRTEDDEYDMIINFCRESDIEIKEGTYKINDLKNLIENKGLLLEWYDYREKEERNIAIKWCKQNNIEYIE